MCSRGELLEDLAALRVELEADDRALPVVEVDARVLQVVPGQIGLRRRPGRPRGCAAISLSRSKAISVSGGRPVGVLRAQQLLGLRRLAHDLELEEAGDLEQVPRARAVDLAARDLHQDPVGALPGDDRIRDALDRIFDAPAQHLEHLRHAALPHLASARPPRASTRAPRRIRAPRRARRAPAPTRAPCRIPPRARPGCAAARPTPRRAPASRPPRRAPRRARRAGIRARARSRRRARRRAPSGFRLAGRGRAGRWSRGSAGSRPAGAPRSSSPRRSS